MGDYLPWITVSPDELRPAFMRRLHDPTSDDDFHNSTMTGSSIFISRTRAFEMSVCTH